ncbi:MAG: hypothetical protein CM15mP31_3830 [Gammaproteobacteria bacterium]|nr:MAG: hypothetical protein CM15mP31_3830 [Gammaproteobacteria bacterium]
MTAVLASVEKSIFQRGGPDGGDGGKGGDVLIRLDKNLNSLISLKGKRQFSATKGKAGSGKIKR